ncbi:MAG TPA: hypothetical protein VFV88_05775 [Steroidobacteraceae bacterium]|jgi:hypothetical protein|nr:hypothetical protein [Steroidobacteraceae bacterium]
MKKFTKNTTRVAWAAATAFLFTSAAFAGGDGFGGDGQWREVDRIEGTWNVKVNITLCNASGQPTDTPVPNVPVFDALAMFAANGTFHDTNASNPAARSPGFGEWHRTGARTYRFAFKLFRFDPLNLMAIGPQVVRHDVVLARDGQSYTSRGTAEWFDASGNPAPPFKTCSISTATRFR